VLSVEKVCKSYGNYAACSDISMKLEPKKIIGLFGANGAGKSTCFHMITGLIKPDSGQIKIDTDDITAFPIYQRASLGLSFLPQDKSIFQDLTVEENILSILEITEKNKKTRVKQLELMIDQFCLNKVRYTLGKLLSGGERRRTEIARAMASKPKFVLLDEPFSGVDPISIQEIKALLKETLTRSDVGILISDHNVSATLPFCDYAYILHQGKKLAEGTPDMIAHNEMAKKYYFGTNS
jgi:lipopolysaccharide export system ATP-binding protein